MKRKYLLFFLLSLLFIPKVKAEYCTLERQAELNNAAGAVTAKGYPYSYNYTSTDPDSGEEITGTSYLGMIDVYNLTSDIYAILEYDSSKYRLDYDPETDGEVSYSTGGMGKVKQYTISIYPVDTECGKKAIRQINVTVPRANQYYNESICSDYPDYFYCQEFMTADDIAYIDFVNGINEYAKTHKSVNDETRKEGILEETTNFVKKHLVIVTVVILIIIGGTGTFIYLRNKKRKEEIV